MGRILHGAVVTLLLLQCGYLFANESGVRQLEYTYDAEIIAANTIRDDVYSRMDLHGKVTVQSYDDKTVMKLSDFTTATYNGLAKEYPVDGKLLEIPEEASFLYDPFIVYYDGYKVKSIGHLPDEPLWSLNIKKAIGSIFQLDFETYSKKSENFTELNIYGKCNIRYEVEQSDDGETIKKIMDECEEDIASNWNNLLPTPVLPENHKVPSIDVVRKYTFNKDVPKTNENVNRIEAEASILYKTMPVDNRAQFINQKQVFTLLSNTVPDKVIDYASLTGVRNVTYQSVEDPKASEENGTRLIEDYDKYYKEFQAYFNTDHLSYYDIQANDTIDQMFHTLTQMSNDMLDFSMLFVFLSEDPQVAGVFMSLMPYIGTEQTTRFIKEIIEEDGLNDLIAIKVLATFPTYISSPSEEILQKLEVLLNLEKVENKNVKYTGILSFASAVADAYNRDGCSKKTFKKYVKKFYNLYQNTEDYELRMIYVLGLSNMGIGLDSEFILPIITNSEEHSQLRALATYAFKREITSEPDEVFSSMWPVVNNKSEPFEVRVSALDLLMGSELTAKQYYAILKRFSKYPAKQTEQHLYQYFYTTILSLQDTTRYSAHLGALATSTFSKIEMPKSYKTLATGNYRLSYTDDEANFGGFFETKLVANPDTNFLDTMQFTTNRFAMTLNLGTYSMYLKLEGLSDVLLEKIFINGDVEKAIPKLVELIRKNNFKLKEFSNIHIDLVLFCDNRAIYAMHLNQNDVQNIFEFGLIGDLLKYMMSHESISFPVMDRSDMPSDLGTQILMRIEETQFYSQDIKNFQKLFDEIDVMDYELKIRSAGEQYKNMYFSNPITNFSISTYDVKYNEYLLILPFVINSTGDYIKWENDNVTLDIIANVTAGTTVEDVTEMTYDFYETANKVEKTVPLAALGMNLKASSSISGSKQFSYKSIMKSHRSNTEPFTTSKTALMLVHLYDYFLYSPPFDTLAISIKNVPLYSEPTESYLSFNLTGDTYKENNDPFDGLEMGAFLTYTNKKVSDDTVLRYWNVSSYVEYTPESANRHKVGRNFGLEIDNEFEDGTKAKFCMDRKILYSGRRADKYSLSPAEASEGKITFAMGPDCSPGNIIADLSASFVITDEQKEYVQSLPEYDICKKQSVGFKYTPPTTECVKVSHLLSNYRHFDFGMHWNLSRYGINPAGFGEDFSVRNELIGTDKENLVEHGFNFSLTYDIHEPKIIIAVQDRKKEESYRTSQYLSELRLTDATVIAYNDEDVTLGLSSNCFITPKNIKTFADDEITNYDKKVNENLVAFVECTNSTRSGLVFSRLNDKHVAFKFWAHDNIVAATISNDKLKVLLNGEIIDKDKVAEDEDLSVYFLDEDVMYVTSDLMEIYYNTEYIILKIFSNYNKIVCGLCSYQH